MKRASVLTPWKLLILQPDVRSAWLFAAVVANDVSVFSDEATGTGSEKKKKKKKKAEKSVEENEKSVEAPGKSILSTP